MRGGAVAKLVTFTGSAVLVGGPVAGALYFLLPSTSVSGGGKASNPRFVMARTKVTDPELSFAYDSFFSEGEVVDKPVTFEKANMSFDGYKLKEGDILCSPKQDGKFYVLKEVSKRSDPSPKYKIQGYEHNDTIVRCNRHDILSRTKYDESKTIELKFFNPIGKNWYSAGIDKIYVSSCVFEATKPQPNTNKWGISWDKCKLTEMGGGGRSNTVPKALLSADYEI
ncbi:hypothetical protein WEN_02500 [Mycoplasma wenyonii str. Massachusetts]|uniref:Uncharacterized protein n=1 Tax=Mycoplasma wenyonii (strain Massachusetts) TaxID=1197325 RepID=I6ZJC2_MYCWM|nr:hypothetical protein [Mycoplasma wenyonii]AFN65285.1 hypothetical protein WEN_02500 [Mycoplasma wenyonii str. Massachusetts]